MVCWFNFISSGPDSLLTDVEYTFTEATLSILSACILLTLGNTTKLISNLSARDSQSFTLTPTRTTVHTPQLTYVTTIPQLVHSI